MTDLVYLNVTERTKFKMTVCVCKNIENLSDSFITIDTNIKRETFSQISPTNSGNQTHYLTDAMSDTLAEWVAMIKPGKASTRLLTPDVRELLATVPIYIRDRCVPAGYFVHGSRIHNTNKHQEQKEIIEDRNIKEEKRLDKIELDKPYVRPQWVTAADVHNLSTACRCVINQIYDIHNSVYFNNEKHIIYAKKLCNWIDLNKYLRGYLPKKECSQDIPWIRKLWNDPSIATN